ncbi:DUF1127 domain-containing protein [Sulfitobacter sp. MF3-043]|uniref:DUF1127 domain-containing protein n=1 Tax=Sulfitobacter sediminivivens TaxID=3252902 RepID=UPI0036D7F788
MTFMDHTHAIPGRPRWRNHASNLLKWWWERRKRRQANKRLSRLPDHLLRDVGLEHLIDLTPDRSFRHRLL